MANISNIPNQAQQTLICLKWLTVSKCALPRCGYNCLLSNKTYVQESRYWLMTYSKTYFLDADVICNKPNDHMMHLLPGPHLNALVLN